VSRVEEYVRTGLDLLKAYYGLNGSILVAVSGGPDSVALLRAIHASGRKIVVAHVNHKLREVESDGDEAFVCELADRLHVPCFVVERPIPANESVEATARNLRYEWFRELAEEQKCDWIATAHTADDQAETVLHRIIRGTGKQGLIGIQFERKIGNEMVVIRPLIHRSRNELLEYLQLLDQPFRIDSSNTDSRFTRNRIRNEIMPMLRLMNPQVDLALKRLSQQATAIQTFISAEVAKLKERVVLPMAGDTHVLDAEQLRAAAPYLEKEFFREFWQANGWPMGEMSDQHWIRLSSQKSGDFPGGISVRRVGKVVQLWRKP
jgi:tRNA(Ile)-lysidine synthase